MTRDFKKGGPTMRLDEMREYRNGYNLKMKDSDPFFKEFGSLDDSVYSEGHISKKNKELMGLAISVTTRCDECILYHMDQCLNEKASKEEIIEAIKIGVMAGGSITFPNARFAFQVLEESITTNA